MNASFPLSALCGKAFLSATIECRRSRRRVALQRLPLTWLHRPRRLPRMGAGDQGFRSSGGRRFGSCLARGRDVRPCSTSWRATPPPMAA